MRADKSCIAEVKEECNTQFHKKKRRKEKRMKMKTSKKSLMELNYILYAREAKETISYCWYIVLVATISFRFYLPGMLACSCSFTLFHLNFLFWKIVS